MRVACGASGAPRLAAGKDATLVVWPAGAEIVDAHVELVPNDAKAARHVPLAVPNEVDPAVLALPDDRFVLLTRAQRAVLARPITIKPAYFTNPPPPRGPVLRGRLLDSRQRPVKAGVGCLWHTGRCGVAESKADGSYALPPSDPLDHRVIMRAESEAVTAVFDNEYWFDPAVRGGTRDIQLAAPAKIVATVGWPGDKLPALRPIEPQYVDMGPRGKQRLPDEDPAEVSIHASPIVPISAPFVPQTAAANVYYGPDQEIPVAATGRVLVVGKTNNKEYGASAWVDVKPGETTRVTLELRKIASVGIRVRGVKLETFDRAMMLDGMCATGMGFACHYSEVSPGPHLVGVTTAEWTMVREIAVSPGKRNIADLQFVADLPPGHPGVKLARDINGISVRAVAPGGPAATLLAVADRIVAIDGKPVTDLVDALARIHGAPSSKVELTIERARQPKRVALTRADGKHPLGYTVVLRDIPTR